VIQHDQPTIFGNDASVVLSSVEDGPMNFKNHDFEEVFSNRSAFFDIAGVDPLQVTLLQVTYQDTTDFTRYKVVEEEYVGEGALEPVSSLEADALVVTRPEQAIFLPLADCTGAVVYDPVNRILMVSHLGRHSVQQLGGRKTVEYLKNEFDSDPSNLLVWLSPAVDKESYPLHAFEGRSLHEVITSQMCEAGVDKNNIEISHVDTAKSDDYYSHSEFKADNQADDGRFAIVAMMVE
jgi:copper oxidase (laccase) domain-containing protein